MNENETNIISKMSIKVIGGGVYLKNKPQTITITWEIKDENGNIITPDTLSVNNIPLDPTTTSKTYHRVFSDVDFTVRAVKDGVLAIGTTTARFVGPTQTVEDSLTSNSRSIAASANSVRLLNEKIENNSSFKGLFTSLDDLKKKLRSGNNGDWAIVGEGIPAPIYIWNKNGWEATGGQYTGSTIDLNNYYTKEDVANYTDDYNVSKNHSHIVKIYDLVNWKVVERKPDAPVFQLGQSYDAGEVVNMTDDNDSSYECLQSTITAPYLSQEVRSFTLAEAISFLPEDLRVTGQKISFLSSELNAWMTYVFTGGDYTNPTYWEIFTNNIDPDTNQKIADLQAKDEDLQNQINEDVTNLNNHIAESDAKFEEIDNTLTEHEDRMDDIEDEILLSSVEAACAPKDVEILADRAYKDHLGNIIADEYITRDTLTEEIIDITNQQVTDLKPGSVQPEDLSEAVKQMIGCKKITNLPDEEDITVTEDNTLKFKDREYSPKDYSGMGKKILRKHYIDGVNTLTQHMINKSNTIYVIRYDYCLQGQTIEIPENCVLDFDGGSLRNGILKGNDTNIVYNDTPIFNSIEINGSWIVEEIYDSMFLSLREENSIKNVFNLSSDKIYNKIVIEERDYVYKVSVNAFNQVCCNVKSNTDLILNGIIELSPNPYTHYHILGMYGAENISICGKGTIKGDKDEHDFTSIYPNSTHEWGHGIVVRGCHNVKISGITSCNVVGDALMISKSAHDDPIKTNFAYSDNIIVCNCTFHSSRRQGITLSSTLNTIISNCIIHDIKGTLPEAGIDLEPESPAITHNTVIENCHISNCTGGISSSMTEADTDLRDYRNLTINNCIFENINTYVFQIVGFGNTTISNCDFKDCSKYIYSFHFSNNAKISNCKTIEDSSIFPRVIAIFNIEATECENINFKNCRFKGQYGIWTSPNITVEDCIFECSTNFAYQSGLSCFRNGVFKNSEIYNFNNLSVDDTLVDHCILVYDKEYTDLLYISDGLALKNNRTEIKNSTFDIRANSTHIFYVNSNNIYVSDNIIKSDVNSNTSIVFFNGNKNNINIKNNKIVGLHYNSYIITNKSTYSLFDDIEVSNYDDNKDYYNIRYFPDNKRLTLSYDGIANVINTHNNLIIKDFRIQSTDIDRAFKITIPSGVYSVVLSINSMYNTVFNRYYQLYNINVTDYCAVNIVHQSNCNLIYTNTKDFSSFKEVGIYLTGFSYDSDNDNWTAYIHNYNNTINCVISMYITSTSTTYFDDIKIDRINYNDVPEELIKPYCYHVFSTFKESELQEFESYFNVNRGTSILYQDRPMVFDSKNFINSMGYSSIAKAGSTSNRPSLIASDSNFQYFDTTINKPIWWTGSNWVDATGVTV